MPAASNCSPLRADKLMGVFWMVELYFSAVTVISSSPVSASAETPAAAAAAAAAAAGDGRLAVRRRLQSTARDWRAPAASCARRTAKATQDRTSFECISTVSRCSPLRYDPRHPLVGAAAWGVMSIPPRSERY